MNVILAIWVIIILFSDFAFQTCDLHREKPLEIYCLDCRQVVCTHCFLVGAHRQHRGQALAEAFAVFEKVFFKSWQYYNIV